MASTYYSQIKDSGVGETTNIELEQYEPLLYPPGKDNGIDEPTGDSHGEGLSALHLTLYLAGIALLSFSRFTTLYILLTPPAPSMDPSRTSPELLYCLSAARLL